MSASTLPARKTRPRLLGLTTPERMVFALAVVAVLACASGAAALSVLAHIRDAVRAIAVDAEPSVVAAQILRGQLAGMDAEAIADALNENAAASGTSNAFRRHLATVQDKIVTASRNITYGEAEAGPIRALLGDLDRYLESLAEARWMARDNPLLAIRRTQWSSRLLNDFALPDAVALEEANLAPLESRYAAYRADSLALGVVPLGALGLVVAALVATQVFLARRTRRLVNIPLAAATVLTVLTISGLTAAMIGEQRDTRAAKEDAFDSIHALYGAKAVAYRLNAERAMWLLDPAGRPVTEVAFAASAAMLLGLDTADPKATGAVLDALTDALDAERAGHPAEALARTPKLRGLLGDELANITFGLAERQPATEAVIALLNYLQVDRDIRRLERANRHFEAVALATDHRADGGVAAFDALDTQLDRTIEVNQREFDRRTNEAVAMMGWLPWAVCGALALTVALAAAGVWQRWREYR
jgi:hypothetical protein